MGIFNLENPESLALNHYPNKLILILKMFTSSAISK